MSKFRKQVSELRLALGDEATFIETHYKRGWQFVADVKQASPPLKPPPSPAPVTDLESVIVPVESAPAQGRKRLLSPRIAAIVFAILCPIVVLMVMSTNGDQVTVLRYQQLTNNGWHKRGPLLTDGNRIFFAEELSGIVRIATISNEGGKETPFPFPLGHYQLAAISADAHTLLVRSTDPEAASLWTVSTNGGEPKRLISVGGAADWSPDGHVLAVSPDESNQLVFHNTTDLTALRSMSVGGSVRTLRWSPDGKRVRLTVFDRAKETESIWDVNKANGAAQRADSLSPDAAFAGQGSWSKNGRYFFYQAGTRHEQDLWVVAETSGLLSIRKLNGSSAVLVQVVTKLLKVAFVIEEVGSPRVRTSDF